MSLLVNLLLFLLRSFHTKMFAIELEFLKSLWGARNRRGIGLSYRPARLHRLAEFIPWNRFLGSINVLKYGLWTQLALSAGSEFFTNENWIYIQEYIFIILITLYCSLFSTGSAEICKEILVTYCNMLNIWLEKS
jgi:hypothetical protein